MKTRLLIILFFVMTLSERVGADDFDWVTAGPGLWGNTANWNPSSGAPPNGPDRAFIFVGGAMVTISDFTLYTVDEFSVGAGTSLELLNNSRLTVQMPGATIVNDGDIFITNTGATFSDLIIDNNVTLNGAGTITLGGTTNNAKIADINSLGVLTNNGNTIQGRGQVGANRMQLINEVAGLIDANDPTGSLTVDPRSADANFNLGTMRASGGGQLILHGGSFNNAGGLIEAQPGSLVTMMNGPVINSGLLQTVGGGVMEIPAGSWATFEDLTINGTVDLQNGGRLFLDGTINNSLSNINVINSGGGTDIEVDNAATLNGFGTITLQGTGNVSRIADPTGSDGVLTNVNNLIQGKGEIGRNTVQIVNMAGIIDANDATGSITFDPRDTDPMINTGIIQATAGGEVIFIDGTINNTGGLISASFGSTITIKERAVITGGTLQSLDTSSIEVPLIPQPATLGDLTIDGTVNQQGAFVNLTGTINNIGNYNVNSTGGQLIADTPVLVSGSGSVNLTQTNSRITGSGDIEFVTQTLTGIGRLDLPSLFNGANIEPGNSIGELDFNADQTIVNSTSIGIELGDANGTAGTDWDLLDVNATLDFDDGTNPTGVRIDMQTLDPNGLPGLLQGFNDHQAYSWTIADANSIADFDSTFFTIDASDFANSHQGIFCVRENGQQLFLDYSPATIVTNPHTISLLFGTYAAGGLPQLVASDDDYLKIQNREPPSPFMPAVNVKFEGTLPTDTPGKLAIKVETAVTNADVRQSVCMFNYQTSAYEEVDYRVKPLNNDTIVELTLAGDVTRFVQPGTGAVIVNLKYFYGPGGIAPIWEVLVDEVSWVIPQ